MFFKEITGIKKIVLGLTVVAAITVACSQNQPTDHSAYQKIADQEMHGIKLDSAGIQTGSSGMATTADTFYTCSMHPQIRQDHPGTCPICHMDLVARVATTGEGIMLNEQQEKMANIHTIHLDNSTLTNTTYAFGRLALDPSGRQVLSARLSGRVERLYVKETGVAVHAGEVLYELYSERLQTLQAEYLIALAQEKAVKSLKASLPQITEAARQRLQLYGMTDRQIADLGATGIPRPTVSFFAAESGTVTAVLVTEGQYVSEGSPVLQLDRLTNLWVEAELYANELTHWKNGQMITVQVAGFENQPVKTRLEFVNPVFEAGRQAATLRAEIANPRLQFQPGMQATVLLSSGKQSTMTLPVDAVLRDGRGATVWVKTGPGAYKSRMVKTGLENADQIEVLSGLKFGDEVVVSGAYLLHSEQMLKQGSDPMAGHKM